MSNRLYYLKVFFLQYKAFVSGGLFLFILGIAAAVFVFRGPEVPRTEEDYTKALKTGERLFEKKHYAEAFEYLVYPGEHGYPQARYLLGEMYYNGWGVEKDVRRAFENYELASEDLIEARYMAASMAFRGEIKGLPKGQATAMLTEAAYHGSVRAQTDFGVYSLMSGDFEQAYFWLSLAAQKGSERASAGVKRAAERLSDYQRGLLDSEIKGFVARK